ncbi:hypothetical protein [Bacillus vallismortis]|uniref:hypothetical protein n=1 Tax=Bacillus vallismortis TaxID=72361 RepID=UPI0015D54A5A
MINGSAYEKGHYISYVAGNIVGTKGAGSAVQTTTKLSKVGKVVEGGSAAAHVNKGINKGKSYLNSFVKNKNDLALVGIAQDIENTYNAKNTPLLKSMIEDKKESVLRRSERSNNKGIEKGKNIKDYKKTFFNEYPDLKGSVVVHHAIEQQILKRHPNLFSIEEIHALENLRGIPKEINSDIHLSKIRRDWNRFYRNNPNPTKEEVINYMIELDKKYGEDFNPPVKR